MTAVTGNTDSTACCWSWFRAEEGMETVGIFETAVSREAGVPWGADEPDVLPEPAALPDNAL